MAYDGSLIFDTKVDTAGFNKGTNTLKKQAAGLSNTFKKLGVTIAGAFAVKKILDVGKQAVQLASDIEEVQNVVDTAFGEMAYKMEEFADTAIETFGISKLTAKQTGSTFMAMARGMGIAIDSASDMAIALTGLSADMASFYNVSQDVASTALKSIFTGETETLKQFGIVMTEANLEAFALSQGITKSYQAMSQAEKVQLRYAYVMNQTKLAQGDFAKTSDSWANQTRILSERWKEFLSILGSGLVKILTPVVKTLNYVMSYLISAAQTASSLLSGLFGEDKAKNQQKVTKAIDSSVSATNDLATAQEKVNKAVKKGVAGFDELNSLNNNKGSDDSNISLGGLSVPNVTATVDVDTSKAEKNLSGFEKKCQDFAKFIKNRFGNVIVNAFENIKKPIGNLKDTFNKMFSDVKKLGEPFVKWVKTGLVDVISAWMEYLSKTVAYSIDFFNKVVGTIWSVISPVLELFVTEGLPRLSAFAVGFYEINSAIIDLASGILNFVWPTVQAFADFFLGVITDLMTIGFDLWDQYGAPLIQKVKDAIDMIGLVLTSLWVNFLKPVVDNILQALKWVWDEGLKPLIKNIGEFVAKVVDLVLTIWNKALGPLVGFLVEKFGPVFSAVFGTITNIVASFYKGIAEIFSNVFKVLSGVIDFIKGVFSGNWKLAWEGIKNIFSGVWNAIVAVFKTPINLIIDMLNGLLRGVIGMVNGIIKTLNKLSFDVPDWVPGIGGEKFGFNLKEVTAPQIPKLATGTVVPANYGEFLAILGDNKKETEVVSPLSTIEKAVENALKRNNGSGNSNNPVVIVLKVGAKEFARVCIDSINELTRMTGQLELDLV